MARLANTRETVIAGAGHMARVSHPDHRGELNSNALCDLFEAEDRK